jgi:peptide/nickel transport system permease protein
VQRYLLGRLALTVPTIIGITMVVFLSVHFLPGDVISQLIGPDVQYVNAETRAAMERRFGLEKSLPQQYLLWGEDLARGSLGRSLISGRPITWDLAARIPVTFELSLLGLGISLMIALPIGGLAATRQDSLIDYVARSLSILALAIPAFWLGLLAITYGFILFHWTPPLHYEALWEHPIANLRIMWVPALILGTFLGSSVMRFTRTAMLEVLRQDYVRTARAKGLAEAAVMARHALRNALIPVVTVIGLQVPLLVGGTVVLEQIFSIPGMGSYLLSSTQQRDYPVVQSIVLITAVVVVVSNLVVDLAYAALDPRIRYS